MSTNVSSVISHFPDCENGFTTTTAGSVSSGAGTVTLNSVAGYTNGEPVVLVIDPTDATKKQTFTGIVDTSGVQITSVAWTAGTNQTHALGATVVDYATATHIAMMSKGIKVNHTQKGNHKTLTDDNANEWIEQGSTGSAINQVKITNAAVGTAPIISASGDDTNIGLTLTPKGTGAIKHTLNYDAWVSGLTAPSTVTALGNRSYSVVINSTDYTDRLSAGMRLRTTRTVAAPTQCTDLEAGSSQYYSKSSPSGMTFTDDFVVSAWVKLESYPSGSMSIVSRLNGTQGWNLNVQSSGQLRLAGFNASLANASYVQSYQSIPLNKWVHIAGQLDMSTFTATTTTSYIMFDGIDVPATVSRSGTNPTALVQAGNLEIGSYNAGTDPFDGKIAQVAIYNAKVTQANILATISQGLSGSETSLISAYSFNNSINDLNANANNLTAQGSAVATATDSPFGGQADGTISSTLDYAIITKTAFSTNTTLTVQVPEGCTIPTSGGVSAVAYSTQKVPYQFPAQRGKWNIRFLLRSTATTASNATFAAMTGMNFTPPIGSWVIGWQSTITVTAVINLYFCLSDESQTGLAAATSDRRLQTHLLGTSGSASNSGDVHLTSNRDLSAATTFTMYSLGATTTGQLEASTAACEFFAECAYL